jgi:hypothetical protein
MFTTKNINMKPNLLLLLFVTMALSASAQTDSVADKKPERPSIAFINTMDGKKIKGWLYKTDAAALYLLHPRTRPLPPLTTNVADLNYPGYTIDALQINTMVLKKRKSGLRGMLIGIGTGIVIGAIAGFASGDDPVTPYTGGFSDIFAAMGNSFAMSAEEKAAAGGILGGLAGGLIGSITGALLKKKIMIGGQKAAYQDAREELNRRSMVKF